MNRYEIYRLPRTPGDVPGFVYEAASPKAHQSEWGHLDRLIEQRDAQGNAVLNPDGTLALVLDPQNYEVVITDISAQVTAAQTALANRKQLFQQIDTQITAIANLADAKLFLSKFCKAVIRHLDLDQ